MAEKSGLKVVSREEKKSHLFLILENKDGAQMKFPVSQKTRISPFLIDQAMAQFKRFAKGLLHGSIIVGAKR